MGPVDNVNNLQPEEAICLQSSACGSDLLNEYVICIYHVTLRRCPARTMVA